MSAEAADRLDRMANPHPRMWDEAQALYRSQRGLRSLLFWRHIAWRAYLKAMCAATGYEPDYFHAKLR